MLALRCALQTRERAHAAATDATSMLQLKRKVLGALICMIVQTHRRVKELRQQPPAMGDESGHCALLCKAHIRGVEDS